MSVEPNIYTVLYTARILIHSGAVVRDRRSEYLLSGLIFNPSVGAIESETNGIYQDEETARKVVLFVIPYFVSPAGIQSQGHPTVR